MRRISQALLKHKPSATSGPPNIVIRNMATKRISLTPPEKLFRQCLLDCRDHMPDVSGMKDLELRWTGGWVRDKLLGATSHDIDVALSTMTGWQFGQALQTYMKEHGNMYEEEARQQGFKAELKNLHKIEANPEKSKHLETITTRMFGIDVDFVNLRKEVYDEKSRNPQMEFGTPEEDALRRDACCNALFYNLDTQQIEDFTGKGLQDMRDKIIRTPLEPYQTFKDDPLRILRLIRFAARLGYTIQDNALKAMADPTIHEALRLKISRERVGVEIGKIILENDPFGGLSRIYDLNLYSTVFADPSSSDSVDASSFPVALKALRQVFNDYPDDPSLCLVLKPQEDMLTAWTLAAYVPFRGSEVSATSAAREGIKATNVIVKTLSDAIKYRKRIQDVLQKADNGNITRAEVGMLLRDCGKAWRFHVLYSLLCDAVEGEFATVRERYATLVKYLQQQRLEGAAEIKSILNGNEVKQAMEIEKAGPWLKKAIDKVVEWQFANPEASAEEARSWIKLNREQLQAG